MMLHFWSVNSVVTDYFCLTTSFNIHLIKPASTGKLLAKGNLKFKSKNIFHAESSLYNEDGIEIAFGTGSFCKSKITLDSKIGLYLDITIFILIKINFFNYICPSIFVC